MKAISPIVATLILIAIAVIAGVFVLRQFLGLGATVRPGDVLQITDTALYLVKKPVQINETFTVTWMTVSVTVTLKNTGTRILTVRDITVDDKPVLGFTSFNMNPGESVTKSYTIILDPATGATTVLYEQYRDWDIGTTHTVRVKFVVLGTVVEQAVQATATVFS